MGKALTKHFFCTSSCISHLTITCRGRYHHYPHFIDEKKKESKSLVQGHTVSSKKSKDSHPEVGDPKAGALTTQPHRLPLTSQSLSFFLHKVIMRIK